MSNNLPTIIQAIDDRACSLFFWRTSTDIIIAPESQYAYKSQGRHIRLDAFDFENGYDFCPRCYNDWDWAAVHGGLARCKTRGCLCAIETTGRSNPSPPLTEEQIIFDEFEDDLHDEIANDIEGGTTHDKFLSILNADPLAQYYTGEHPASRAKDNIDNPPTIGEDMNGAREEEEVTHPIWWLKSPQGNNNNKEEQ